MGIFLQSTKLSRHHGLAHSCYIVVKRTISKLPSNQTKLAEVGRLEAPKLEGKYDTGQLFLHRVFGYRGIVLFPWKARVYDRDLHNPNKFQPARQKITSDSVATSTPENAEKLKGSEKGGDGIVAPGSTTAQADSTTGSTAGEAGITPEASVASPASSSTSASSTRAANASSGSTSGSNANTSSSSTQATDGAVKEVKGKMHTFYQVLIDSRDCPYIRAQTEAVTFLGNQDSNRSLYAIPGLDYVAHDDVMPYASGERHPLQHELFEKFLLHVPDKDPPFEGRDTLKAWQDKNHPWLELSDVHKETTENVRVTVIPFYMGCRETPASSVYWWRYCIRLENLGSLSVQLRERHWRIFSLSGTLETVRGRGVVGQEPILSPRLPAFQYSSHVSLQAPSGHMWGTFRLEREDGHTFDCKIPPFSLESKPEDVAPATTDGGSKAGDTD